MQQHLLLPHPLCKSIPTDDACNVIITILTIKHEQACVVQQVRQMVDTNITALALVTRLFSPGMVQRNRGHIINISSVAAHTAYKGATAQKPAFCGKPAATCLQTYDCGGMSAVNCLH